MDVSQEKWDSLFHNYKEPWKCVGRKKPTGCTICDKIDNVGIDNKNNSFILTIIGDMHSDLNVVNNVLNTSRASTCISVGDLSIYPDHFSAKIDKKSYSNSNKKIGNIIELYNSNKLVPFNAEILAIKGNHDNFINLKHNIFKTLNITYLDNGKLLKIGNLVIATIGGIYSPKKFFWNSSDLKEYNKRFFTKEDINLLYEQVDKLGKHVDILITHEAASGILPKMPSGVDEGSDVLKEVLLKLNPTYYIHGHHHRNYTSSFNNTNIIGLGNLGVDPTSYVNFNIVTNKLME